MSSFPTVPPVPPPRKRPTPKRHASSHWHLPRRLVISGAIVLILIGIAAGKGWAALESQSPGVVKVPVRTQHSPDTTVPTPGSQAMVPLEVPETTTTTVDPLIARVAPSIGYWQAIHQCEQPGGEWDIAGYFGNGLHGGGGLGISDAAWHAWGGDEFAPAPGQASPLQQMVVASRGLQQVGSGAWGCRA